jgi:voltage-gated potassium channel
MPQVTSTVPGPAPALRPPGSPRTFSMRWWFRPERLTLALFAAVFAGGTLGYVLIEGWSAWDAFYMTVITVTTVGYREVHPLSRPGEVFTVALLVTGVGILFYAVTLFVARVVESGLSHRWEERRRTRMIQELANHYIVCGYGRIGRIIVEELKRQRVPFVVIERSGDLVHAVIEAGDLAVTADASDEDVLRRVHVERARGLIAAVGTDAENVYTVLTARLLRPDLFIISRAETDEAVSKLKQAGANRVISPYRIGGQHIAHTALRPAVVDFVQLATSSTSLELAMEQVRVSAGAPMAGRSLVEANVRQRFGVIVVAVQRGQKTEFNPDPEARLEIGDELLVIGAPDSLKRFNAEARTPTAQD